MEPEKSRRILVAQGRQRYEPVGQGRTWISAAEGPGVGAGGSGGGGVVVGDRGSLRACVGSEAGRGRPKPACFVRFELD
jgi:hypothetical protein